MAKAMTLNPFQYLDGNGNPLAGGKVYTYEPGTTTEKATYSSASETTQNENPVILDSSGRAQIWGNGAYKFVVRDANDVTIQTIDNTDSGLDEPFFQALSGTGAQTVFTVSADLGVDENALMIFIGTDAPLLPSQYTIAGTTLTFSSAPASGTNNIRIYAPSLNLGSASSAAASALASAASATASASSATSSASTATTQAGIATTQAGIATTKAAEAAASAAGVNMPSLGAANTVLKVNAGGTALEYGKAASANMDIASATSGTIASADKILFADADDSDNVKRTTAGDIAALVQPTGKIEPTYDNAAGSGWLFLNGDTIGDVGSGATHAAADCEDLFKWFWARLGNTYFAVSGGRGASAQADWDAGKTGTMPDWRGRAPIGAGTGSGLTNRVLGSTGGEETHDQTTAEMPSHTHTITLGTRDLQSGSNSAYYDGTGASETSSSAGSGDPFNVMQPWTAVNWQIKK